MINPFISKIIMSICGFHIFYLISVLFTSISSENKDKFFTYISFSCLISLSLLIQCYNEVVIANTLLLPSLGRNALSSTSSINMISIVVFL